VALQLFKTKSPDHLLAEAAAPERQMKRSLSLIAANAATIFHRQSASRALHGGIHRLQTDREDAQPTDTIGAKTDSLRAVCLE
jgi:hypothetical protein